MIRNPFVETFAAQKHRSSHATESNGCGICPSKADVDGIGRDKTTL
jgi:hypothetical protein